MLHGLKKYKPVEIIVRQDLGMVTETEADAIEASKTEELMRQQGYNNVSAVEGALG